MPLQDDPEPVSESPAEEPREFRSGFVAIVGKPNAGKSTLMNALTGMKLAAVSEKPQTTRDRIRGILTTEAYQIVLVDTPGVMVPDENDRFNEVLMQRAEEGTGEVDVILHLVDAADDTPANERLTRLMTRVKHAARILVITKTDTVGKGGTKKEATVPHGRLDAPSSLEHPAAAPGVIYDAVQRISAVHKRGLDRLLEAVVKRLPEGPPLFDPEDATDRDERFLTAELVREKVFVHLGQEVPYSVFVEVEEFREARPEKGYPKDLIRMTIYVERDSQKGIIIGHKGTMLQTIGSEARADIERLTGRPCFLELRVKVRPDWRRNPFDLGNFGFKAQKKARSKASKTRQRKGR